MNTRLSKNRSGQALLVAVAISLVLAGCTPGEPTPTPTETAGALPTIPSPTPTLDPLAGPESVLGIGCDALFGTASVSGSFSVPVSAINAGVAEMNSSIAISPAYFVRSLSGLACEWNNGQPKETFPGGDNPAYRGVQVLVLPNAASQWTKFQALYAGTSAVGTSCFTIDAISSCETNQIVGTNWVRARIIGATSDATATALAASAVAAVGAAGPGAAVWSPRSGTLLLPPNCEGVVANATVQSALGLGSAVEASTGGGGWSLGAAAAENWGGPRCAWLFPFSDSGVGSLSTLRGGAWAWAEARANITFPAAPTAAAITGLAAGDEAWIRCVAADAACVIDLVVGGNWLEAYVWRDAGPGVDHRAAALALGTAIVASLTP